MVCHETYKDDKGNWLYPDEVEKFQKMLLKLTKQSSCWLLSQCLNQKILLIPRR